MIPVQRWSLNTNGSIVTEDETGSLVEFSAIAPLLAELEALRAKKDRVCLVEDIIPSRTDHTHCGTWNSTERFCPYCGGRIEEAKP